MTGWLFSEFTLSIQPLGSWTEYSHYVECTKKVHSENIE